MFSQGINREQQTFCLIIDKTIKRDLSFRSKVDIKCRIISELFSCEHTEIFVLPVRDTVNRTMVFIVLLITPFLSFIVQICYLIKTICTYPVKDNR